MISQQLKALEKPGTFDKKSVFIEHPKAFHKLSKAIRQVEKVSKVSGAGKNSCSFFYSETTKSEKYFERRKTIKNAKIIKLPHGGKGYASTFNVEILNSFNSTT